MFLHRKLNLIWETVCHRAKETKISESDFAKCRSMSDFICLSVCLSVCPSEKICSPSTGHNFGVIASKFFSQIGIQPIRKPLDFGGNRMMGSGLKKSRKIPKIPISHHCGNFKNSYLHQKWSEMSYIHWRPLLDKYLP